MPTRRYAKLPPETRRRILDAARAEFVIHGFEEASLNQIIQNAGINKGSLYYYFADKADLFMTVAHDAQDEMLRGMGIERVDTIQPPEDFWGYIVEISHRKVSFALSHPDILKLFSHLFVASRRNGAPEVFKAFMAESIAFTRALLAKGQEQGAVRTDLPLDLLVDLMMGVSEIMNRPLLEDPSLIESYGLDKIRAYSAVQVDMTKRMLQREKATT